MRQLNGLTLFWDGIFSNFYPCKFIVDDVEFNSSEQYFMYKKAMTFNDRAIASLILQSNNPTEQKRLGRAVGDYNDKIWAVLRYVYMYEACYAKFSQNKDLAQELLKTQGTQMVEASPYDRIWGIGLSETDPRSLDPSQWLGLNLLGKVLDEVREQLFIDKVFEDL